PARPLVASVTSLPPTRPSPRSTPFPYTTLFRSLRRRGRAEPDFPSYQLTFKIPVMGFVTAELSQKREGLNCLLRALKRMLVAYSDRKSTRLNSSHGSISYPVFCLKKKTTDQNHE